MSSPTSPPLPPAGSHASFPLRFTQADFDRFARLSGDDNPIHVDPAFATGTRFGRTVAHGMLLFAASHALLNRWVGGRPVLHEQQFMFPAPTFAGEALTLHLAVPVVEDEAYRRVELVIGTTNRETCRGQSLIGFVPPEENATVSPPTAPGADHLKGMSVGRKADRTRRLSIEDVRSFVGLVDDPHPDYHGETPLVPPPLLGGMISDLLGVSLPGPGANWLKQTYRFHRPVPAGVEIRASVTITRLRPEKDLVNLSTVCETDAGIAVTGEALVLARDVAER